MISNRVWRLRQLAADMPVSFHRSCATASEMEALRSKDELPAPLVSYFRLDIQFETLFSTWLERDHLLRKFFLSLDDIKDVNRFKGLRLLNQDPQETIFSFITSANNNVPRISKLLNALSAKYGERQWSNGKVSIYSFPNLEVLAGNGLIADLRKIGFGYRAKFIPYGPNLNTFLIYFEFYFWIYFKKREIPLQCCRAEINGGWW